MKMESKSIYLAKNGYQIAVSGEDIFIEVFSNEEEFKNKYPNSPSFSDDGFCYWEE